MIVCMIGQLDSLRGYLVYPAVIICMIGQLDSLKCYSVYPAGIVCVIGQLNSLRGYSVYPAGIVCVIGQLYSLRSYSVYPAGISLCERTAWRTERLFSLSCWEQFVWGTAWLAKELFTVSPAGFICVRRWLKLHSQRLCMLFSAGVCVCVRG